MSTLTDPANDPFWNPPTLGELMTHTVPLSEDEQFEIDDLAEREWQAFVDVLEE